ncbi:TM2 domain-containing protein [Lachnoclostridium sp. Marseille-P6806]|uniref:TM2 domain-containing protein n=1 Tax=Lachnoclostridium sp. Marseille-P6806 TaxID=2364793 RepID=UPI001F5F737E|nr:TM2 domain-containing protein [Lachnoclostridium sp. Marseille-P6806]
MRKNVNRKGVMQEAVSMGHGADRAGARRPAGGAGGEAPVSAAEFIRLEEELLRLRESTGKRQPESRFVRWVDGLVQRRKYVSVNRKKYICLALSAGWLCGAHRFYAGRKLLGFLYLLFCWTGIPLAMTLIDLMIVLPMKEDEKGEVVL